VYSQPKKNKKGLSETHRSLVIILASKRDDENDDRASRPVIQRIPRLNVKVFILM
jgi:hypothetical protein